MKPGLSGKRVLIVEDEYFLADDLASEVTRAGGEPVGPAAELQDALRLIHDRRLDVAVLDIDLRGETGFLIADVLAARAIPFVFATGFDAEMIPQRYVQIARWEKPFQAAALVETLVSAGSGPSRPTG